VLFKRHYDKYLRLSQKYEEARNIAYYLEEKYHEIKVGPDSSFHFPAWHTAHKSLAGYSLPAADALGVLLIQESLRPRTIARSFPSPEKEGFRL